MNVKHFITASIIALVLLLVAFTSSSSQQAWEYDPWADMDGNGKIDMFDIGYLCLLFNTKGTPINKTALLGLSDRIAELEARVNALEANYSVTNLKLAPYAIPFNSTYGWIIDTYDSTTDWGDMDDMSLTISLNRISHLLIIFSTEAYNTVDNSRINARALVDGVTALPGEICLTPFVGENWSHRHYIDYMAYSYNFYQPSISPGTHTVKIQWKVSGISGGTGYVRCRTLTVIALPA